MPVFFKLSKRVLFVHVPKTGGTSIEFFFESNGFNIAYLDRGESPTSLNSHRRCSPQHMHASLLNAIFDVSTFDYVFMMVRHPFYRLRSRYAMDIQSSQTKLPLELWLRENLLKSAVDASFMDNHFRPQCEFFLPNASVFRYENGFGQEFVDMLERGIGINFSQRAIGHEMRTGVADQDTGFISQGVKSLVWNAYERDFKEFGYGSDFA